MNEQTEFGNFIKEKIMNKTVSITFPIPVLTRLQEFSKQKTNDCYWLAIDTLLDRSNISEQIDIKTVLLMDRDIHLQEQITKLRTELNSLYKLVNDIVEQPKTMSKKKYFGTSTKKGDEE